VLNTYILDTDGRTPIQCDDLLQWTKWFHVTINRKVNYTIINTNVSVSTIFIGIDYSFGNSDKPILWETMIFGGYGKTRRYSSYEDAVKGHAEVIKHAEKAARKETNSSKTPKA